MNVIELENLTFKRNSQFIFDGLSLNIPAQGIHAIMGPSGCGKTTLLKLITAQVTPLSGTVRLLGENIHKLNRKSLFSLRKKIGMLFQQGGLLADLSVFDNIALPLREHTSLSESVIRNLVIMKLEMVGLRGIALTFPSELSGGMARRVSLARAIALDPEIVFYDEPFTGQDPISTGVLVRLIDICTRNSSATSVVVSHDVPQILSIADTACILSQGQVIASAKADQIMSDATLDVKQFIRGEPDGPIPFHKPTNIPYPEVLLQ